MLTVKDCLTYHGKSLDQCQWVIDNFKNHELDIIVTMGCGDVCPFVPKIKKIEWQIPDPKFFESKKFDQVRDLIKSKIISELL